MKRALMIIITLFFLSGCLSISRPQENTRLEEVYEISVIEGVYKNKGNPRGFYLSELLWRWILKSHEHDRIELIKIEIKNSNIVVTALRNGSVYFQKEYVKGIDFDFRNGKIYLHAFRMKRRPHDLCYGPSYQKEIFALDIDGNIKYESKMFGLVLFRSFLPVMAADFALEKFERVY